MSPVQAERRRPSWMRKAEPFAIIIYLIIIESNIKYIDKHTYFTYTVGPIIKT